MESGNESEEIIPTPLNAPAKHTTSAEEDLLDHTENVELEEKDAEECKSRPVVYQRKAGGRRAKPVGVGLRNPPAKNGVQSRGRGLKASKNAEDELTAQDKNTKARKTKGRVEKSACEVGQAGAPESAGGPEVPGQKDSSENELSDDEIPSPSRATQADPGLRPSSKEGKSSPQPDSRKEGSENSFSSPSSAERKRKQIKSGTHSDDKHVAGVDDDVTRAGSAPESAKISPKQGGNGGLHQPEKKAKKAQGAGVQNNKENKSPLHVQKPAMRSALPAQAFSGTAAGKSGSKRKFLSVSSHTSDGVQDAAASACCFLGEYCLLDDRLGDGRESHCVSPAGGNDARVPVIHVLDPACSVRSIKVLLAIACGAKFVRPEWVFASISTEKWLPVDDYMVSSDENGWIDAQKIREKKIREAGAGKKEAFLEGFLGGKRIGYHGVLGEGVHPAQMSRLVLHCGGTLADEVCDIVLVGALDTFSHADPAFRPKPTRSSTAAFVKMEWLWDSVVTWSFKNLANYYAK